MLDLANIVGSIEKAIEVAVDFLADLISQFKRLYPNHVGGLFINGDVAGQHSDTRSESGWNDYSIIKRELAKYKPQMRVGTKAPSVVMSTNFLNSILDDSENIKINIDFSCKKMINDLLYLKQDSSGGKLIQYEKHPQTGTRYEKYGHFFDLLRYHLVNTFAREYQEFQTGSKPFSKLKVGSGTKISRNGY
jgi:hypothetical protein